MPRKIEFAQIRDGAYTAAVEQGADLIHAQILAGHKTGIKDAYIRRKPTMVKDAREAIERAYFGPPDKAHKTEPNTGSKSNSKGRPPARK